MVFGSTESLLGPSNAPGKPDGRYFEEHYARCHRLRLGACPGSCEPELGLSFAASAFPVETSGGGALAGTSVRLRRAVEAPGAGSGVATVPGVSGWLRGGLGAEVGERGAPRVVGGAGPHGPSRSVGSPD